MKIKIKLLASIGAERSKTAEHEYPPATKVEQVVGGLGIPEKTIGIVLVNGHHASLSDLLEDGDTLSLFPLVDGG